MACLVKNIAPGGHLLAVLPWYRLGLPVCWLRTACVLPARSLLRYVTSGMDLARGVQDRIDFARST
eukprot:363446-Chlamydomonas_euryale.AAC.18